MENQPSQKLFDEILKQGLGYIDDAISNKTVENYYLDFKITEEKDYDSRRSLFMSDKKNYAKAISAFGNSEGGVLVWGIKTGKADADYATSKEPIENVSNFLSLLEGFTSLLTSPPHPNVSNKIIFDNESVDTGYVVTYISKSNRRPFQVLNDNDFRYYIRAGSSSLPASDAFLRSLFGQEPQPDVFFNFTVGTPEVDQEKTIKIKVGIVLHNGGENVAKNVNGYVLIGGLNTALQMTDPSQFSYYKNEMNGLKIGFTAKPDFILGVEQEVQPLVMYICLKQLIAENGIQIIGLVSSDNQVSYRFTKMIEKEELEKMYNKYMEDSEYRIAEEILKER